MQHWKPGTCAKCGAEGEVQKHSGLCRPCDWDCYADPEEPNPYEEGSQ